MCPKCALRGGKTNFPHIFFSHRGHPQRKIGRIKKKLTGATVQQIPLFIYASDFFPLLSNGEDAEREGCPHRGRRGLEPGGREMRGSNLCHDIAIVNTLYSVYIFF